MVTLERGVPYKSINPLTKATPFSFMLPSIFASLTTTAAEPLLKTLTGKSSCLLANPPTPLNNELSRVTSMGEGSITRVEMRDTKTPPLDFSHLGAQLQLAPSSKNAKSRSCFTPVSSLTLNTVIKTLFATPTSYTAP